MSTSRQKWVRSLLSSSLVRPPPPDSNQRKAEILAHVELFGQFASEAFGNDISELVRSHYPCAEVCLLDDVLAMFLLHHPEHGHAILHALLSCIIDGTISYNMMTPPFGSFIHLFSPSSEHLQKDLSEHWALACGEILQVLTHYNRPICKGDRSDLGLRAIERKGGEASSSTALSDGQVEGLSVDKNQERKTPTRLLTPWITDSLRAAPLGARSDYFRWCGGVMGKYAAGGELKPPTTVGACGPGKHPQLMPSTPRWAVANGAAVILSVCDDEVSRYETAELTAAAVPALLLPPPARALDEHLVTGLPPLEPYARLFHRYYAIATAGATQRLFLGLLEAPPSWAPDALDAAVQLVELLRAAEDYSSSMQLSKNWLDLHFLRPIGTAMAMQTGIAADAAAALLFRLFSQPCLLFPPPGHAQGAQPIYGSSSQSSMREHIEVAVARATEEATARGVASLVHDNGPDVEWRIGTIWEAAYGLLPLSSSTVNLPELVLATPLQPPLLSWSLFRPLVRVLEYLPHGSPSEACLLRIFTATVEAILHRTFPLEKNKEKRNNCIKSAHIGHVGIGLKQLAITELRAMVHSLFTEECPSAGLAAQLLSVAFTVCLSHDAVQQGRKKLNTCRSSIISNDGEMQVSIKSLSSVQSPMKERGAVSTLDSYIVAAVCALACEVQLLSISAPIFGASKQFSYKTGGLTALGFPGIKNVSSLQNGVASAVDHARKLLRLLESLLALAPSSGDSIPGGGNSSSGEISAAAVVTAHISELLGSSKACMHALTAIMRCKWEIVLAAKAASVLALIDGNGKVVSAVVASAEVSQPDEVSSEAALPESMDFNSVESMHEARIQNVSAVSQSQDVVQTLQVCHGCDRGSLDPYGGPEQKSVSASLKASARKSLVILPINASDVVSLLCMEKHDGLHGSIGTLAKAVLKEKEELSMAALPLLWQKLISVPDLPTGGESTSAKSGWRQIVEALCNVVLVYPGKAAPAILFQAERDLQPWIGKEDEPKFQHNWKVNKRTVCLLTELLRLHSAPESLSAVAKFAVLLDRTTEKMVVDGEPCTMSQLELLEAAAVATRVLMAFGNLYSSAINSLSTLLKNRLPSIVRCLSHNSARVRALSMALLRDALYSQPAVPTFQEEVKDAGLHSDDKHREKNLSYDWTQSVEQCVAWEIHYLRSMGMSTSLLTNAAGSLGCAVPV